MFRQPYPEGPRGLGWWDVSTKLQVNDTMLKLAADCSGGTKKAVINSALEETEKPEIGTFPGLLYRILVWPILMLPHIPSPTKCRPGNWDLEILLLCISFLLPGLQQAWSLDLFSQGQAMLTVRPRRPAGCPGWACVCGLGYSHTCIRDSSLGKSRGRKRKEGQEMESGGHFSLFPLHRPKIPNSNQAS